MKAIKIDIVSDIACPWCAIGYARLERALQGLNDEVSANIEWHAFELNPEPNLTPEPILPALAHKYGRPEADIQASQAQMTDVATALGLNFSKMQTRYTTNTFDAHRLVKWAATQSTEHPSGNAQTAMKLALFEAYFGDALNMAEQETLLACVKSAGLNVAAATEVLNSDSYADAVRADEQAYQQAGVNAVPAFIIGRDDGKKYLISGAQEAKTLENAIRDIANQVA